LHPVLASPDTEIAPQISHSRKFPQALLSIKTWSNRVIKTPLRSPRCAQRHIKTSTPSDPSFIERSSLQLAHSWHKRRSQKLMLRCQRYMESQHSKSIESIERPLHNISPLHGSVQFFLASPDTETAAHISLSRNFPHPLLSTRTWSNRVIKIALRSPWCALR
jgi:hypothetical protein